MVVLPKVTNTYISNRKDNSFSLFWDSVNLIDGYIIINKNNNSTTRQTNNNIDFTNLLPDTNYNIEIFTYK
jgi:chitodextrinase